jgi:hypothetical protein
MKGWLSVALVIALGALVVLSTVWPVFAASSGKGGI